MTKKDPVVMQVIRKIDNDVVMWTNDPKCIYPDKILKDLAANGYKVLINGTTYKPGRG